MKRLLLVILATDSAPGNVIAPIPGYASMEECQHAAAEAAKVRPITTTCIPGPNSGTPSR
jgi:hypothetical protein